MKAIVKTIFFTIVLTASTAQSDIVVTDFGTNKWVSDRGLRYLPQDQRHFLEGADEFTLYSLEPGPVPKGTNTFCFHKILGQIKIEQGAERTNLVTALADGIAENVEPADCFNPRHGIRAAKNGVAVDFVICFQCAAIEVFSSKGTNWSFSVSRETAALFNQTLQKAGVPLPTN